MATVTLEVDSNSALVRHIEDLQRSLTKRNKTIEDLTSQLEAGEGSEYVVQARQRGYREGWQAAASQLMQASQSAAVELRKINREAWDAYLKGERVVPASAGSGMEKGA